MQVKYAAENCYCEYEIRDWACGDDCGPLPDFLSRETHFSLLCRHCLDEGFPWHRSIVCVALEPDKAAERKSRYFPTGSVAIMKSKELGSEAERKNFDFNSAPPADQKMTKLVEENHQAEDEEKRQHAPSERPNRRKHWHWTP